MVWNRLAKYAWGVVGYVLLVIGFGVFVRMTGSGDGCGSHWPLCDGEIIPKAPDMEKLIEFSHRVSSGLVLPLVLALVYLVFGQFPRGHIARKGAGVALLLTLAEAGIGAGLVLFGLVDRNDSVARAGVMSFHVISTYLLVGALAIVAFQAMGAPKFKLRGQGPLGAGVLLGVFALCFLGMSGAISSLGNQLKAAPNVLAAAVQADTHWMVRLQPLHPLIAVSIGLYLLLLGGLLIHLRPDDRVRTSVRWMVGLYGAQMALGILNIFLKAPIWLAMIHLVVADVIFISLMACMMFSFGEGVKRAESSEADVREAFGASAQSFGDLVKGYVILTKPRVISLLLFTTLTAMFIAAGGWPGFGLFMAVAIGGYMAAGAANAINMVIDRDIDATMKRTSKRPTVTNSISSRNALIFSGVLAMGSFALLWAAANLLAAVMAFAGLVFYVVVYTLMLKRRTWQNIVIGGAAGAFPPMVGYAAVTNELSPLAWLLFTIIFMWTPVHFWALALLIKDDYASAGVPMLPVVRGVKTTVIQIAMYTVLTAIVSVLPLFQPKQIGSIYLYTAIVLNVVLVIRTIQLYKEPERPQAVSLYKYSMLYLALLFLSMAIDRSILL